MCTNPGVTVATGPQKRHFPSHDESAHMLQDNVDGVILQGGVSASTPVTETTCNYNHRVILALPLLLEPNRSYSRYMRWNPHRPDLDPPEH